MSEDLDGLLALVRRSEDPTSSSPTSGCRRPGTDEGVRAAQQLRETHPRTGVVVLSHYLEPAYALALFAEGAHGRGYLLKERVSDVDQLARRDP